MSAIDRLQKKLFAIAQSSVELPFSSQSLLKSKNNLKELKLWRNNDFAATSSVDDKTKKALKYFQENLKFSSISDMYRVCVASAVYIEHFNCCLIEDARSFPHLLSGVKNHQKTPSIFRRCYQGLLHTYFSYNINVEHARPEGKINWHDLRGFLSNYVNVLQNRTGVNDSISWVNFVKLHANLFSNNPCSDYAVLALADDHRVFNQVCQTLSISDSSWLIQEYICQQINVACNLKDEIFKAKIVGLLALLSQHELLIDRCLGLIINRYHKIVSPEPNENLRDFSVKYWQNPWLESNAKHWGSVTKEARDMIASWLKLHLITQFFEMFSDNPNADKRRIQFWKKYYRDIDDMYFVLGKDASENQHPKFLEIKTAMKGRVFGLYGSDRANNAFIMLIKKFMVVEFSKTGNAAYLFKRDQIDAVLKSNFNSSINIALLKNGSSLAFLEKLIHGKSWESKFHEVLGTNISSSKKSDMQMLDFLVKAQGLIVQDHRAEGGYLIVKKIPPESISVATQDHLKQMGFEWSVRYSGYYRDH